jgi:hypothetical protein
MVCSTLLKGQASSGCEQDEHDRPGCTSGPRGTHPSREKIARRGLRRITFRVVDAGGRSLFRFAAQRRLAVDGSRRTRHQAPGTRLISCDAAAGRQTAEGARPLSIGVALLDDGCHSRRVRRQGERTESTESKDGVAGVDEWQWVAGASPGALVLQEPASCARYRLRLRLPLLPCCGRPLQGLRYGLFPPTRLFCPLHLKHRQAISSA